MFTSAMLMQVPDPGTQGVTLATVIAIFLYLLIPKLPRIVEAFTNLVEGIASGITGLFKSGAGAIEASMKERTARVSDLGDHVQTLIDELREQSRKAQQREDLALAREERANARTDAVINTMQDFVGQQRMTNATLASILTLLTGRQQPEPTAPEPTTPPFNGEE